MVGLAGVRLTPLKGLRVDINDAWGDNMFNTFYTEADYLYPLNDDWKVRVSAQLTDQRAVGDANVDNAHERFWATQVGGVRGQVLYRDLTVTTAFSITADGNTIQTPWGSYPGYLSLIDRGIASPEDVDKAVRYGFGMRYLAAGPVLQKELSGLDVNLSASRAV